MPLGYIPVIDFYFLLEKYPLVEIIALFKEKYGHIEYNTLHLLKSLVYFSDAEDDPMPKMQREVSWETVKKRLQEEVRKLV